MNLTKNALRHEARQKRGQENVPRGTFEAAKTLFFSQIPLKGSEIIAGYWPSGNEFDVTPILEEALKHGHQCVLPVINDNENRILQFREWHKNVALVEGVHGIFYSEKGKLLLPDIVIVPLLAFDKQGNRLGQGGGYYDATLSDLRAQKDILAVGLAYASQACLSGLPCEAHDQKLDMVVTEKQVLDFRNQSPEKY